MLGHNGGAVLDRVETITWPASRTMRAGWPD